jgi:hypothetical protein
MIPDRSDAPVQAEATAVQSSRQVWSCQLDAAPGLLAK